MLALFAAFTTVTSAYSLRHFRAHNVSTALVPAFVGAAVSCSTANDLAKNFVVTIDNDAPAQGTNVTTTFDFDLDAPIMGGTAYYSATLNGLGPFTSSAPLCDETAKTGDPCPLVTGHHHEVSTAENTVTGKVVTTITWMDPAGLQILCARISTKSS
jgi:hypothetical protein